MAKSIEQKVVDSISAGLSDNRFQYQEFNRLMTNASPTVHKSFFNLMVGYFNHLAVFDTYEYYPNLTLDEAVVAGKIVNHLNSLVQS